VIDSFWIGSVLVIVLTGLYTMLGGIGRWLQRPVQVVILITGSALLTVYRPGQAGGWSVLRGAVRLGHVQPVETLIPPGMEGTWAPVKEPPASPAYFNTTSLAGHGHLRPVIGLWYWCTSSTCPAGPGAPNEAIAGRQLSSPVSEAVSVYMFIIPGLICLPGQERKVPSCSRSCSPRTVIDPQHAKAHFR